MYQGGGYSFGRYDSRTGKEPSSIIGSQSAGNLSLKFLYQDEEDKEDKEDEEDEEYYQPFDKEINSKIVSSLPMGITDPYAYTAVDKAAGQLKNTGGVSNVFEYAGAHKNYIRKGISPFKAKKHSAVPMSTGGSDKAFSTTGNFVGIGTQYGSSRPHKLMTDIEDNNIFNLQDMDDPLERSFKRQQNRIKKVLSEITEYLKK